MSLEELWQLFPIQLTAHNSEWFNWYAEERAKLQGILGCEVAQIDHIGSTAVPGLIAKPIIDILLQLKPDANLAQVKSQLLDDGWLVMAELPGIGGLDLNKAYRPTHPNTLLQQLKVLILCGFRACWCGWHSCQLRLFSGGDAT